MVGPGIEENQPLKTANSVASLVSTGNLSGGKYDMMAWEALMPVPCVA